MFRNNKRSTNIIILIIGISIIGSLIFTIIGINKQKNTLQVYDGNDKINNIDSTEEELNIVTNTYVDDDNLFSLQIPDGWERVVRNGHTEFIHTPSATSVSINIQPYDPSVNALDPTTVSASLLNEGYQYLNCDYINGYSSEIIYQKTGNKTYDYIEENIWCREYVVTLLFTLSDDNYEKMQPYLNKIFNSFEWSDNVTPIPEGYHLIYISIGDFEFLVPDTWTVGSEGNSVVCANQENNAQMIVKVQDFTDDLSNMTSYDLAALIKPGRENGFIITNSSASINKASAESSYLSADGYNMFNKTYLYANGYYLYTIQFDYLANSIDETLPDTCSSYFREFVTKKLQDEMDNASATDATASDAE